MRNEASVQANRMVEGQKNRKGRERGRTLSLKPRGPEGNLGR